MGVIIIIIVIIPIFQMSKLRCREIIQKLAQIHMTRIRTQAVRLQNVGSLTTSLSCASLKNKQWDVGVGEVPYTWDSKNQIRSNPVKELTMENI